MKQEDHYLSGFTKQGIQSRVDIASVSLRPLQQLMSVRATRRRVFRGIMIASVAGIVSQVATKHGTNASPALPMQRPQAQEMAPTFELDPAMQGVWNRTDGPVKDGKVSRSWYWGPEARTPIMWEPYAEASGGKRMVVYFDKSRMEITHPDSDPTSEWYVTNGLLAKEMVTGQLQLGDNSFEQRWPAVVNVAGDLNVTDIDTPTFVTFQELTGIVAALDPGTDVTAHINRPGKVTGGESADGVKIATYVSETGHNLPNVFWDFLTARGPVYDENGNLIDDQLQPNPFYATGYPITEPYWGNFTVGGVKQKVLVQIFERRVLTYTPSNSEGWKIEAGNVGLQYYIWRYGIAPDSIVNQNLNRDFNVSTGNGWEFDNAKDAPIQVVPTNIDNLNQLPQMFKQLTGEDMPTTLRIVLGGSTQEIENDFGVSESQFQTFEYTDASSTQIGRAILSDPQGEWYSRPFYVWLTPDVMSRVDGDVNGLATYFAAQSLMQTVGEKMTESMSMSTGDSFQPLYKYIAENITVVTNR